MLALGTWLAYGAVQAVLLYMQSGGDVMSALFEPPTSAIRITGALLLMLGGLLAASRVKGGGIIGVVGSLVLAALGGLMAQQGAQQELWLDELIYGFAGLALSALILTFRRANPE